jgi:hypothetical protein
VFVGVIRFVRNNGIGGSKFAKYAELNVEVIYGDGDIQKMNVDRKWERNSDLLRIPSSTLTYRSSLPPRITSGSCFLHHHMAVIPKYMNEVEYID